MHVLVLYAHPSENSFVGALHMKIVEIMRSRGHSVDDLDLYAEKFDPVLSHDAFVNYVDTKTNAKEVVSYVKRLRAADALVLVFPVWFDGLPAILQGFFQRVFLPGVAITIDESGLFHPNLQRIKRLVTICTYGESWRAISKKGNPPRRFIKHNIGALIAPDGSFDYFAHYGMNFTTSRRRERFFERVTRAFSAW
jgi:NAD(P)H dehydrogenase (quinone)